MTRGGTGGRSIDAGDAGRGRRRRRTVGSTWVPFCFSDRSALLQRRFNPPGDTNPLGMTRTFGGIVVSVSPRSARARHGSSAPSGDSGRRAAVASGGSAGSATPSSGPSSWHPDRLRVRSLALVDPVSHGSTSTRGDSGSAFKRRGRCRRLTARSSAVQKRPDEARGRGRCKTSERQSQPILAFGEPSVARQQLGSAASKRIVHPR
jgi:hypothetical protein